MAVVQISKIQVRRGKKNQGTGMPQLASGEFAWAIDTQELYIGNGAVGEGAPYVGNTKILTEHDSLLDLAGIYRYKKESVIPIAGTVDRSLQDRLDDGIVNVKNFDIKNTFELEVGEDPDQSAKIQVAVDELTKINGLKSAVLEFNPGEYVINQTIILPSNVRIIGAGKASYSREIISEPYVIDNGTAFKFTGNGSAFQTEDAAEKINLQNFSIVLENTSCTGILTNDSKNLNFVDVGFAYYNGLTLQGQSVDNLIGLMITGVSTDIRNNKFKGLEFVGLSYAVYFEGNVSYNSFDGCKLSYLYEGFNFGNLSSEGANFNSVKNSVFDQITRHGIIVNQGYGNLSQGNTYKQVGGYSFNVIRFLTSGNNSQNDIFERSKLLENQEAYNGFAYVPEVGGVVFREKPEPIKLNLSSTFGTYALAFRLPAEDSIGYQVNYIYKSLNFNQTKKGTLSITFDINTNQLELVEESEYAGIDPLLEDALNFRVTYSTVSGVKHINVEYVNNNGTPTELDENTFTYSYSVIS